MDFFTVATITFNLLYCFFVIDHYRRRILHFNVTASDRRMGRQQLREAFPYDSVPKYLIFDRGTHFNEKLLTR